MLKTPVTSWNSVADTRTAMLSRSSACARSRAGGQVNRRGYTDQSFAASSGTAASPVATCRPCVIRYTLTGRDGHENHHGGCWIAWLRYPVTKQIPTATPSATPRWLVSRVERSREEKAPARHGPRRKASGGAGSGRLSNALTRRQGWRTIVSPPSTARARRASSPRPAAPPRPGARRRYRRAAGTAAAAAPGRRRCRCCHRPAGRAATAPRRGAGRRTRSPGRPGALWCRRDRPGGAERRRRPPPGAARWRRWPAALSSRRSGQVVAYRGGEPPMWTVGRHRVGVLGGVHVAQRRQRDHPQPEAPPPTVVGRPQHRVGAVERLARRVQQGGGQLRGVHADQHARGARPRGVVKAVGQPLVQTAAALRHDAPSGRHPVLSTEDGGTADGRRGAEHVDGVAQRGIGDGGRLGWRAGRAEPRLDPPGHRRLRDEQELDVHRASTFAMSRTVRAGPRTVPVTLDRPPARGA